MKSNYLTSFAAYGAAWLWGGVHKSLQDDDKVSKFLRCPLTLSSTPQQFYSISVLVEFLSYSFGCLNLNGLLAT